MARPDCASHFSETRKNAAVSRRVRKGEPSKARWEVSVPPTRERAFNALLLNRYEHRPIAKQSVQDQR